MKLRRANKPIHGLGEHGQVHRKAGLMAGEPKGSPSPGVSARKGVRGNPDSHMGDAGRGGTGRHGKGDNYKGRPTSSSETITHEAFEKLGAS